MHLASALIKMDYLFSVVHLQGQRQRKIMFPWNIQCCLNLRHQLCFYLVHPSGKEPLESVWKRETKLKRWFGGAICLSCSSVRHCSSHMHCSVYWSSCQSQSDVKWKTAVQQEKPSSPSLCYSFRSKNVDTPWWTHTCIPAKAADWCRITVKVIKAGFLLRAVVMGRAATQNKTEPDGAGPQLWFASFFRFRRLFFHAARPSSPWRDAAMSALASLLGFSELPRWRSISSLWFRNKTDCAGEVRNEGRWEGEKDGGRKKRDERKVWPAAMESCNRHCMSSWRLKRMWAFIWN